MNIKKNDIIELTLTDMNNLGNGVGHTPDGVAVFVGGGVVGDALKVKVIKVAKSYLVARIEEILAPSPVREVTPICTAPASCGGCSYRNLKYEEELRIKRDYVKGAFRKAGLFDVEVEDTRTTGVRCGYRNKAQYPVRATKSGMRAGFFANKTHDLIPSDKCMLQPEIFTSIVDFVLNFCTRHGITAYDEESGRGVLRHIYLREGHDTGEIMLCLVINARGLACESELAREVQKNFPPVVSVMLNFNEKSTNVVLGDEYKCIGGRDYIEDVLCGKRFRISAGSFYQVNHDAAELLYGLARERADLHGGEILADLYCGIGTIGMCIADGTKTLVGVEIVPEAVECAEENAKLNGMENAHFFCGDANDVGGILAGARATLGDFVPDVVVIDPPRKGSTCELVKYLNDIGVRRVVYISCNPDTLARDCTYFKEFGYQIGAVTPVDLFPGTGHVECVVRIDKL